MMNLAGGLEGLGNFLAVRYFSVHNFVLQAVCHPCWVKIRIAW